MKTTGYLIPGVRAALRRGDCDEARRLVGDAQRGRLTARQQVHVARLLRTVERCDIKHAGVGRVRRHRTLGATKRRAPFAAGDAVKLSSIMRPIPPMQGRPWVTKDTELVVARVEGTGARTNPYRVATVIRGGDPSQLFWFEPTDVEKSGLGRSRRRRLGAPPKFIGVDRGAATALSQGRWTPLRKDETTTIREYESPAGPWRLTATTDGEWFVRGPDPDAPGDHMEYASGTSTDIDSGRDADILKEAKKRAEAAYKAARVKAGLGRTWRARRQR